MDIMSTSNKNEDSDLKNDELIENETTQSDLIHPLAQELKDAPFLKEEDHAIAFSTAAKDANIGAMLKRVREERGLSIKVVSQQTKIHLALLEALEDNQLIRLPSKTYVKGFVKSYAKILNIPQQEAIDLFENTYREYEGFPPANTPATTEITKELPKNSKPLNSPDTISKIANVASHNGGMIIKIGLALFVVAVVGINLKSMIERSMEDSTPEELPEVISTTTKPKKIEKPVQTAAPVTPVEAPKAEEVPAINIITKETIKPDVKIDDDLTLKAMSVVEKQQKEITMSKEDLDQYLPARFRVAGAPGTEHVFINATEGDSWLTYKTDENDIKKFVLRQGRTLFLRGKEIRLFIGNTKNVKIFHNNKPIEFITPTGIKNAVFPESLKSKFMNPLFVFQKDGTVITSEEAALKANEKTVETAKKPEPSKPLATPQQ